MNIPGGSLKDFYMTVPLKHSDAGAELKMIRYRTDWHPAVVSETFVTTNHGMNNYMAERYGLSFVMSVVLLVAALLVLFIGLVMRFWYRQPIDMLYAALGVADVALWLLSVSQFTPLITGIYFADGIMGFMFCMLMPFALLIYINAIQKQRYIRCYSVLFMLSLTSFVLWTVLHFSGIQSFQTSLIYMDLILGLVIVSVLVTLIIDIRKGHTREYPYTALGFALFMVLSITEIVMLLVFELNSEIPILSGLLCLLILVMFQQVDDIRKEKRLLVDQVNSKIRENEQMLIHIVQTLAGTIDAKDTYTKGHSSRVAEYSREIARRYGYDEMALNDIYMMGLLHDIGKIGIPDAIINKPGKLTTEEYDIIKKHPTMGGIILDNISEKPELSMGARWHHERFGGGGYPDGISGEQIPEQARIIAVADAYDAMTSYRSYRAPMPQHKVREEIENGKGRQFDPRFADIMLGMMAEDTAYSMRESSGQDT